MQPKAQLEKIQSILITTAIACLILLLSFPTQSVNASKLNLAISRGTYYLPYTEGTSYRVSRTDHSSTGTSYAVDFAMPVGSTVRASADGEIIKIIENNTKSGCDASYAKYNNMVVILHPNGEVSYYLHLSTNSVPDYLYARNGKTPGYQVHRGEIIGKSGKIGYVCGKNPAHLHFHVLNKMGGSRVKIKFGDVKGGFVAAGSSYKSGNTSYFTPTPSPIVTSTKSITPTVTYTTTPTNTPTFTLSPTATEITATPTFTYTPTKTATSTSTFTPTFTFTPTPTATIAPFEIQVNLFGAGFTSSYVGGWVYISTQHPVYWSCSGNPIYTRTRTVGYTNDVDWAKWTPSLPLSGYYDVYASAPNYPHSMDITNQAIYRVFHADGQTNVTSAQSNWSGQWMPLGTFRFYAGSSGYVYMGDYTGDNPVKLISADCVKFVWAHP